MVSTDIGIVTDPYGRARSCAVRGMAAGVNMNNGDAEGEKRGKENEENCTIIECLKNAPFFVKKSFLKQSKCTMYNVYLLICILNNIPPAVLSLLL